MEEEVQVGQNTFKGEGPRSSSVWELKVGKDENYSDFLFSSNSRLQVLQLLRRKHLKEAAAVCITRLGYMGKLGDMKSCWYRCD